MSENLIATDWADFRARVIPPEATAAQVSDMRMAFYGGAMCCFGLMMETAALSQSEAMKVYFQLQAEFFAFGNKMTGEDLKP